MKRKGKMFEKMCSMENLELAYINARKGKLRTYGVKMFEKDKENNLRVLQTDLLSLNFKTSKYHTFTINEYGKDRVISRLPFYPDRIVHHLLMLELENIWVKVFIRNTYACIKGRGIHDGLSRVVSSLNDTENTQYCLKIDVRKFYPSINHDILKQIIRKKIKDNDLLFVLDEIIDSSDGVPIGNYLSQYFANLYLAYFDHYMKEVQQVKCYHRYADDIVILHSDKNYLHALLVNISDYFNENLKLTVKHNYQIFPVKSRGIDYLGYKTFHTHTLLRKSIKQRMFRSLRNVTQTKLPLKLAAYNGWMVHCNSHNLRIKINEMNEKRFGDFGIKVDVVALMGDKIKIAKVIGKEILVKDYKVTESKYEKTAHCLTIQIEIGGEDKVIFTGSGMLKRQIEQIDKENFPFLATIENINETYQFI
jgi:RNA-directed DNA polymerase